jgi:hypothetical protein
MQVRRKPRNFAPHGVAMHGAAADRFVKHPGRLLERFARLRFVSAGGDGFRGSLGEATGPRPDGAVALCALDTLPMALFGRWVNGNMRHNQSYVTAEAGRSNTSRSIVVGHFENALEILSARPIWYWGWGRQSNAAISQSPDLAIRCRASSVWRCRSCLPAVVLRVCSALASAARGPDSDRGRLRFGLSDLVSGSDEKL